jgi:methionyl-tRNA formyltransferase
MKIAIFCEIKDSFFHDYLESLKNKLKKYDKVSIFTNYNQQKSKNDLAFFISCRSKILEKHLKKNKLNLVIHPSKLPDGKGSGIISWKILENKKKLWISFFRPKLENFDCGDILMQDYFLLEGDELCDEIRAKQAKKTIEMCEKIILNLKRKKIKFFKQKILRSKFYRIRNPNDSKININKDLNSQFNLLRVSDNERYPAFFYKKGKKYILKIFKK